MQRHPLPDQDAVRGRRVPTTFTTQGTASGEAGAGAAAQEDTQGDEAGMVAIQMRRGLRLMQNGKRQAGGECEGQRKSKCTKMQEQMHQDARMLPT
jgi:hypothetical protein